MFTIRGTGKGYGAHVFYDTADEAEQIILALGGEQGCARHGKKADTIRTRRSINVPGPAMYWRALLCGDLSRLAERIRTKGKSSAQAAREWGLPNDLVSQAEDMAALGITSLPEVG